MNKIQKKFILKKLIPFILRERGRGFAMDHWLENFDAGDLICMDGVIRKVPVCNTICCIGGSIEFLREGRMTSYHSDSEEAVSYASNALGISKDEARGLFFNWAATDKPAYNGYGWPEKFAATFKKRKSPLGKAKVAVALLKEVVRTDGACLSIGPHE